MNHCTICGNNLPKQKYTCEEAGYSDTCNPKEDSRSYTDRRIDEINGYRLIEKEELIKVFKGEIVMPVSELTKQLEASLKYQRDKLEEAIRVLIERYEGDNYIDCDELLEEFDNQK